MDASRGHNIGLLSRNVPCIISYNYIITYILTFDKFRYIFLWIFLLDK